MNLLIEKYINNMSLYDIQNFAIHNDVFLSNKELNFVYDFLKDNWKIILSNKGNVDISKYKDKFSEDNYNKIVNLIDYYKNKYRSFLN